MTTPRPTSPRNPTPSGPAHTAPIPLGPAPAAATPCRPRLPRPQHTHLYSPAHYAHSCRPRPLHPLLQATPTTPTPAGPARTGRPGLRAILAAHVVWAGAVVVPLQVVAPGPVLAGAWLTEVDVHLWGGSGHEGAAGTGPWARARPYEQSPRPGPHSDQTPGLRSRGLQDGLAQPVCLDPWLDGNTWAGQALPPPRPGAALFRGLPGRHPAFAPPTGRKAGSRYSCGSF